MPAKLPIKLDDLLRQRTVEGERIEYKAGRNPDAILRTICAFANDFANLGGGYVVIGQDCDADGRPLFPPVGLPQNQLDKIQRELLAHCQLIQPPYFPVLSIEDVESRTLIVMWAQHPDRRAVVPEGAGRGPLRGEDVQGAARPHDARGAGLHPAQPLARDGGEAPAAGGGRALLELPLCRRRRSGGECGLSPLIRGARADRGTNQPREGRATGIPKILKVMAANGSPPPMFETDDDRTYFVNRLPVHDGARGGWSPEVTPEVTPEVPPQFAAFVDRLLAVLEGEMSRQQLQAALQLKDDKHFREAFLQPALVARLVVMTQPDHPRSSKQRYRLTAEGRLRRSQLDAAR